MELSCQKISKTYVRGVLHVNAVHPTSLKFTKGLHIITGKSGSGKSTLMNMLGGLEKPDNGKVFYDNKSIYSLNDEEQSKIRLKNIGFVFQFFNLIFELNVIDNITLASHIDSTVSTDKAKCIAEELSLGHLLSRMPNELSGGEQQRVAIARALVKEPQVIFADEPTGNLDSKNSIEIMDILSKQSKYKTVVMVTHDIDLVNYGDFHHEMLDGKLVIDNKESSCSL